MILVRIEQATDMLKTNLKDANSMVHVINILGMKIKLQKSIFQNGGLC